MHVRIVITAVVLDYSHVSSTVYSLGNVAATITFLRGMLANSFRAFRILKWAYAGTIVDKLPFKRLKVYVNVNIFEFSVGTERV